LLPQIDQAVLAANVLGDDLFPAIEAGMPWGEFAQRVTDAELLAQPDAFDHLPPWVHV
jgi:hypothetical protein